MAIENREGDTTLINQLIGGKQPTDRQHDKRKATNITEDSKQQEAQRKWLSVWNDALFDTIWQGGI